MSEKSKLDASVAVLPAAEAKKKQPASSRKAIAAVAIAIALGGGGAVYIAAPKSSVSTDNAYVQADSSIVAPKVLGAGIAVNVATRIQGKQTEVTKVQIPAENPWRE